MFSSTVLDVAVGLIFTFLAVSLATSAAVESLATILKWRSGTLLAGVKALVNDPQFTGLAKTLYDHALVNPREDVGADPAKLGLKPSYIDPKHFADALVETVGLVGKTPDEAKAAIGQSALLTPQIKTMLNGMVDRAAGSVDAVRDDVAAWFDNAMDRVGGAYKRRTQLVSFVIALIVAVGLNVDSVRVGTVLWHQPMITKNITLPAETDVTQIMYEVDQVKLPVGWGEDVRAALATRGGAASAVAGWLITALATLFGAPFWFDALQTVIRLKGSGPSPAEKKAQSGASA